MIVYAHLTFNGNCRQAMTFYQKCFGGDVVFQTVGESPSSSKLPTKMKDCIVHATLTRSDLLLMGSDMVAEPGLIKGNAVTLSLHCQSEKEVKLIYRKLSKGAIYALPLHVNQSGFFVGEITDKFGHHWLLTC